MSNKYLVYENYETALSKAEVEGQAMGLPYYSTDPSVKKGASKYRTSPKELSNGKWALKVTDYISLTEDENSSVVSSVTYSFSN
jgi:hypothetical protein